MIALDDFKPKSVTDGVWATLRDKDVCIPFSDSTKIILRDCLTESYPSSVIQIKDLFKGDMDQANQTSFAEATAFKLPKNLKWVTFQVNDLDLAVFNSIASSDADLFWTSVVRIDTETHLLCINVLGLVYSIDYKIPKAIEESMTFYLRWSAYYYLYKMFKGVTKKKLGAIKIGRTSDNVYITNDAEDVIIICNQVGTILSYKNTSLPVMEKSLSKLEWLTRDTASKKLLVTTDNTLFKHLSKPFKDVVSQFECPQAMKYTDNLYYTLYLFKKR